MSSASISRERSEFLASDFQRGFIAHVGFVAEEVKKGFFSSSLQIKPEHRQQDGFVHAGVMAAMADHTAGYAGFTLVSEDHQILTIEFKINFLRPASGDTLRCHSRVIREGRQLLVAESEVFDQGPHAEKATAKALVTLMAVPRERLGTGKE